MRSLRLSIFKALALAACVLFVTGCAALQPKAKADYTTDVANMDFVFVKGGTFEMGSLDYSEEQPVHTVTVPDLFVGMHEVTFDQFIQYCQATPNCEMPRPDKGWGQATRPVIYVNWHDANAYAAWLSEQTGFTVRLPSEAEWEYFARAGTTTRYWSGVTIKDNVANCRNCNEERLVKTVPVGSFAPNPWGLYDILGNVQEWTLDDYREDYTLAPVDGKPLVDANAKGKSIRGGSWRTPTNNTTSASREVAPAHKADDRTGFRLVIEPSENGPILQSQ